MYLVEVGACDLQSGLLFTYTIFCFIASRMDLIIMSGCVPYFWHPLSRRSGFPASALSVCRRNLISPLAARIHTLSYFAADAAKKISRSTSLLFFCSQRTKYLCCFLRGLSHKPLALSQMQMRCVKEQRLAKLLCLCGDEQTAQTLPFLLFVLLSVLHFSCVFCM